MTGYGRGEATSGDVTVVVELRSVNNRFRDIQLRCPREYLALEPRIQRVLKGPFHRGRIEAHIRRSAAGGGVTVIADPTMAKRYGEAIRAVMAQIEGAPSEIPLDFLLAQPGVLTVGESDVDVLTEWDVVETALESAVADLATMRGTEGTALRADLAQNLAQIREGVADLEAASEGINERLQQRLENRLNRLIGDRVDAYRLAQEVAILADKADVSEETARLGSHCEQFSEALDSEEPVGRRLDFLLQEMNREVNTIGSKAAELPISRRVVDLKATLEKMREQSANVE